VLISWEILTLGIRSVTRYLIPYAVIRALLRLLTIIKLLLFRIYSGVNIGFSINL
jgi:hypothetical protein